MLAIENIVHPIADAHLYRVDLIQVKILHHAENRNLRQRTLVFLVGVQVTDGYQFKADIRYEFPEPFIQEKIFGNKLDDNGVLIRSATDKPPYYAVGFMSEKSNGKYRYVWLYKVRAKPVTENYATKAGTTITRQTGEIEWTASARRS